MIVVFFFVFVLPSCVPLVCSATTYDNISMPICPKSFFCPTIGPFMYPFYEANATETQCVLIKVNCSLNYANLQFRDEDSSYEIVSKLGPGPDIMVRNTTFQKLIESQSLEALESNLTSPISLFSISSTQPTITLFKCTKHAPKAEAYFKRYGYNSNKSSRDHNFYYKHPHISSSSVPNDIAQPCQVIRLPMKWPPADGDECDDETNIFCLLTHEFSISFNLSPSCHGCHKKDINCHLDNKGQFECLTANKVMCVGAITVIIMIIVCFRRKLRCGTKAKNDVNEEMFIRNHEFLAPRRYSYSQVKNITSSFNVKLGQGGFGSVYRGALSDGTLVAVKVLSELKGKGEDFINEVASVGMTSHVNIVTLLGFCLEGHHRALIYEFMPNGSPERFIYGWGSSRNSNLGWGKLQQIAIGIARGLEYLHSGCNTRILHFDIKPHNILLDQDLCPKISDFGLAKLLPDRRSIISISCMRGTPGYIAPELFNRSFGQISHKADVYSYGMMILEMVGGRKNIEVEVDHTSEIYFPHWIYKKIELNEEKLVLHGIMSDVENEVARKMIIVGLWCIQTNPLSRPTITKVLEMFEGNLASMEIPPKPYLSSPSSCAPKSCGDGLEIRFPFHIEGLQPWDCGYRGFGVYCNNNRTFLNQTSVNNYLVKEMNYTPTTMLLVNAQNTTCPSALTNMTFDPERYQLDPNRHEPDGQELVFLMNCSTEIPQKLRRYMIGSCNPDIVLVMLSSDGNLRIGKEVCGHVVVVPVEGPVGEVVDAGNYVELMLRGFTMEWLAPTCYTCEFSGGRCASSANMLNVGCLCPNTVAFDVSCPIGKTTSFRFLYVKGKFSLRIKKKLNVNLMSLFELCFRRKLTGTSRPNVHSCAYHN
ncbi:hypothetical protein OSB04_021550 [Centaurea solstitialis]|uniref:non-specific serine/threonine protein kinase n=1 Tax=Centaurea solstitialis TaxID=347529 RepID=A0AA38W513_9ASTR|nr:hypothetical protein OSB04_021550 [Centaurea solstitialis]